MVDGAFSQKFAAKRTWKVDEKLFAAMLRVVPEGASVVDLGAGGGHYVARWRQEGRVSIGVDATEGIFSISDGMVLQKSLADPDMWMPYWEGCCDVATCIEVGEHIPSEYNEIVFDNICYIAESLIIISWAVPGQRGKGHINCQTPEWVVDQMSKRRWMVDEASTTILREDTGRHWNKKLLAFTKETA